MYRLSENIDNNKIFIVNRSEIEGRIDPYFYKEEFSEIDNKLSKIKISTIRKESIKIFSGITPLSGGSAYTDKDNGIPFVRSGDFSEESIIDFSELNYITADTHNKVMKGSKLLKGDLLIAIVGATIGKVGVYDYNTEANINQAICGVRFNNNINPYFVHIFLLTRLGQKILDRLKRPVARANINLEEIGTIPIPLMDISEQNKIVKFYNDKILEKQQKEAEAQKLLERIDDYLLGELGIVLPNEEDLQITEYDTSYGFAFSNENPLVKNGRLFLASSKEINGRRLDPDYTIKSKFFSGNIGIYPYTNLKNLLIKAPQYGANEEAQDIKNKNDVRYIRITDIDEIGNLKLENKKTASLIEEKYILNHNDLLFARSGSVGKCYIHKDITNTYIFAGYLIRFVVDAEKCNPDFIFYYCHSTLYKKWVSAIERPAVQSNINAEEYKSLPIPLPSLDKQQEIVDKISQIRMKAKQLQQEAIQILEQTKQQIEQMILGS